MDRIKIINDDCIKALKTLDANSVDSIVTDPPAGIGFMGERWDNFRKREHFIAWLQKVAKECLRVLKPGGHALVWALPKTSHWTATAWENAGFEVRDRIGYCFGTGFPKSLDIGKAIDKLQGNEREVIGIKHPKYKDGIPGGRGFHGCFGRNGGDRDIPEMLTRGNSQWEGWGTALKPAVEDWWLLRKPMSENTVAKNILKWGVGGINIDACRIPLNGERNPSGSAKRVFKSNAYTNDKIYGDNKETPNSGRFPSNFIIDDSEEVKSLFPYSKAGSFKGQGTKSGGIWQKSTGKPAGMEYGDFGSAARFFYCAKASRAERDAGLESVDEDEVPYSKYRENFKETKSFVTHYPDGTKRPVNKIKNNHPTIKPIALMKYLVRLVTPAGGIVIDPFMGSGTTGIAAILQGYKFIGIENNKGYYDIARARIYYWIDNQQAGYNYSEQTVLNLNMS